MTARARKYFRNIKSKNYTWKLTFPADFDYNRKEVPVLSFFDLPSIKGLSDKMYFHFDEEGIATTIDPNNNTQKCVDWMNEHWKEDGPFVFIEEGKIGQVRSISGTIIEGKIDMSILNQRTDAERSVATDAK